jgi:hypothetical protein
VEDDKKAVGIASALLVLVLGGVFYYYKTAGSASASVPPEAAAPAPAPQSAPPGEALPKLEESDGFVRGKAGFFSSDPAFAAWLKTDDLLPRFAAAVNMIGKGKVPKDGLSFMAPHKKFKARKRDEFFFADPAGYARYDAAAGAIASIDAAAAAKFIRNYRTLVQEAFDGLGEKGDAQAAIIAAAQELLNAPAAGPSAALKEKGLVYAYVDDSLERRSPAQKQLMRMGPKNEAKIQAKVREFVAALGAPDSSPPK